MKLSQREIETALSKDLIPQKVLRFLLGRKLLETLEKRRELPRVVSGLHTALYSSRRYLAVRARLDSGELVVHLKKGRKT